MYWLSLGTWDVSLGTFFKCERVFKKKVGWPHFNKCYFALWSPVIHVRLRYRALFSDIGYRFSMWLARLNY